MRIVTIIIGYIATFFVLYGAVRAGVAAGMEDAWRRRAKQATPTSGEE